MGNKKAKKRPVKKSQAQAAPSRVKGLTAAIIVISVLGIGILGFFLTKPAPANPDPETVKISKDVQKAIGEPLPATNFGGNAAMAYEVAKEIPGVLDRMKCYCGCEAGGHQSLLACFLDNHGAGCGICIDEALMAKDLYNRGYKVKDIRRGIDTRFKKS